MDQYGAVIDVESGVDTTDEEALKLYSSMVTCELSYFLGAVSEAKRS
jgi:hypothetical protein